MADLDGLGGWRAVLTELTAGRDLSGELAGAAMGSVLSGEATAAQIAGFIVALRMKGEAVAEVSGMVDAMLANASPITLPAGVDPVDIVGTGGGPVRREHALNVSTMACFVAAGAGITICKHGNRRASSTSGSTDVLDALGLAVELDGPAVARCIEQAGVGFCFARTFHPAMRHAGPVRAELGVPTVFNFLGPLSNPARVRRQVIGLSDPRMVPTVVGVLAERGMERAMVVLGGDGMDELTLTTTTTVNELRDGTVTTYELDPTSFGLALVEPAALAGGDGDANAAIARRVLAGEPGPYRDIVTLNAAAALVVGGAVDTIPDGLDAARASIDEGRAAAVLDAAIRASQAAALA